MSNESTVTVRFFGICMHVRRRHLDRVGPAQISPSTEHRVILVHASEERIRKYGLDERHQIEPHFAELRIAQDQLRDPLEQEPDWFRRRSDPTSGVAVWPLQGVSLTIEDAIGQDSGDIACCIPRLRDYTTSLPELIERNRGAAGDPGETSCFFDFPRIDVEGESTTDGASVGVITVAVPADPCLKVTHFVDGSSFLLPLRGGAEISVWNAPEDLNCDNNADFLLYFLGLATHSVPDDAKYPKPEGWRPCASPGDPGGDVRGVMAGPGCSNSLYP